MRCSGREPHGRPWRTDLIKKVKGSRLPIRPIQDIKACVEKIRGGKPQKARLVHRLVAVVERVDGTLLDTVWRLAE